MRMIDADAFDRALQGAQAECRKQGGNFRYGVLSTVRENLAMMPTVEMPGWISRKDKLPDKDGVYLTLTYDALGQAYPQIGMYRDGEWMWCAYVYYWMPIPKAPEPPEEVQK